MTESESEQEAQAETYAEQDPVPSYGTAGRLCIPAVGITVALDWCDVYADGDGAQSVVDWHDSAAYFWLDGIHVIADHSNQAFDLLSEVEVGDVAYVEDGSETTAYVCICVTDGVNTGHDIQTYDGTSASDYADVSLVIYTCMNGWQNIRITMWSLL